MSEEESIGSTWEDQSPLSPTKLNTMTAPALTGLEITQLGNTQPGMTVHCIEDYLTKFKAGYTYMRNQHNNAWIQQTMSAHAHDGVADLQGGTYESILLANAYRYLVYDYPVFRTGDFYITAGSSGTITNQSSHILVDSGAAVGNTEDLMIGGSKVDFDQKMSYFCTMKSRDSIRTGIRFGVNCESISDPESFSNTLGLESCDDIGTARNYGLFSADQIERDTTITALAVQQDFDVAVRPPGIRIEYFPTSMIKFKIDAVNPGLIKTTNVPYTGSTFRDRTLRFSIRTNEGSEKQMRLYKCRLVGSIEPTSDPW
jgi:hypothetical protein